MVGGAVSSVRPVSKPLPGAQEADAGDAAVSDVLGAILLVGLTVGMTVILGILLLAYDGPQAAPHARLSITAHPGAGGWGTGDEAIRIEHLGGDPLATSTAVAIRVGGASTLVTGPSLGGAFADGRLAIGEAWSRTLTIPQGQLVAVDVIGQGDSTSVLASVALVASSAVGP